MGERGRGGGGGGPLKAWDSKYVEGVKTWLSCSLIDIISYLVILYISTPTRIEMSHDIIDTILVWIKCHHWYNIHTYIPTNIHYISIIHNKLSSVCVCVIMRSLCVYMYTFMYIHNMTIHVYM